MVKPVKWNFHTDTGFMETVGVEMKDINENSVTHSSKKENQCDFEAKEKWWHAKSICTLWWGHEFQRIYEIVRRAHLWWWRGKEWWSCVLTGGCRSRRERRWGKIEAMLPLCPPANRAMKNPSAMQHCTVVCFSLPRWRGGGSSSTFFTNRCDCTSLAPRPGAPGAQRKLFWQKFCKMCLSKKKYK